VLGVDDVAAAVASVVNGGRRVIDVGRIDDDLFLLNASTGWDAAVIEGVDDTYKRFGRLGYVASGVRAWLRSETGEVNIDLDGERWYAGRAMTVLVLNVGQRGSASLSLAPDGGPDDGELDVLVLRRDTTSAIARAGWSIMRGHEPHPSDVAVARGRTIDVEWERDVASQRDGDEDVPVAAVSYRCDPGALSVCVPRSESSREPRGRVAT
jgi:diacylglycerol kinase family enzyme